MSDFYFDNTAANMATTFFERFLRHSKGEWAGQSFELEPWQRDEIIKPLFGWKRYKDNTRRYRTAYIEIPRKNGKSTLAAGIGLFLLFADNEPGAEIYSAAVDREQAKIVFDESSRMVEQSPDLDARAEVYKRSIVVPGTYSSFKVLSADAYSKHGLNAHGVIIDELHAHRNRDLVDTLATSTGSRRQPLIVFITTAGFDRPSIAKEYHDYAEAILNGVFEDPSFFAYIKAADPAEPWDDPETWIRANPNYGITVKPDYLAAQAIKARMSPAYENTFKRLHLDLWTGQVTRWLPLAAWDKCAQAVNSNLLKGAECYGGLDLASTSDLASFVLTFPTEAGEIERYAWIPFFWIPGDNIAERVKAHSVPYDVWIKAGLITPTPGNVIDYDRIVADIEALSGEYNIKEIAFDRWGAFQVSQKLQAAGLEMIGFGQGFASMANPTKELLRITLDVKLAHGGNPVLRWMADNMAVASDAAGNVKPDKKRAKDKIDGVVAGIMGLDRAMRHKQHGDQSVYETRGLITI